MTRTVDVQGHLIPEAYFHELSRRADDDPAIAHLLTQMDAADPERRLQRLDDERVAAMDAAGIDVQVISLTPPGAAFAPKERAAEVAASLNDALIEAAGLYPGRFLVLCSLPFPHTEESVAELERLSESPLVRGALIDTHSASFTIDEPQFEPIYAKLAELRMPAVLHPSIDGPVSFHQYGISSSLGLMVSTSAAGLRLILGGTLDRVPDLDLVIPHLGGTIPYLTQRVIDLNGKGEAEHDLLYYLRNRVWTDTCSYWHPALRCALETFGEDRVMLGSDYPFRGTLDVCTKDIETADLDEVTRTAILRRTAERWFGEDPRPRP